MALSLSEVRQRIDQIDLAILRLLEQRLMLAEDIAQIKAGYEESALTDVSREQAIIERLRQATDHPVLQAQVANFFSLCMNMTKQICKMRQQQALGANIPPTEKDHNATYPPDGAKR